MMNPQQGHHGSGAVGVNGKKIGGQFQGVNHAAADDIFFGHRETLTLPRPQARPAPVQAAPARAARPSSPRFYIPRSVQLGGAAVMAAGGFAATTAGTAMAASAGFPAGVAVLLLGAMATMASVKTADSAL